MRKLFVRIIISLSLMAVGLALMGSGSPSPGVGANAPRPVIAKFEGGLIDLTQGWGAARSCVVFLDRQVECYRSDVDANTAVGYLQPSGVTETAFDCAFTWLCIFSGTGGTGRRLLFNDEQWHHLADYGFANATKSWRNNQGSCYDTGILGDGFGGALTLEGCARGAAIGSYWSFNVVDVHG